MTYLQGSPEHQDLMHDAECARLDAEIKELTRKVRIGAKVEKALHDWVCMQSSENTHRLYTEALAYFGINPVIPD